MTCCSSRARAAATCTSGPATTSCRCLRARPACSACGRSCSTSASRRSPTWSSGSRTPAAAIQAANVDLVLEDVVIPASGYGFPLPTHGTFGIRRKITDRNRHRAGLLAEPSPVPAAALLPRAARPTPTAAASTSSSTSWSSVPAAWPPTATIHRCWSSRPSWTGRTQSDAEGAKGGNPRRLRRLGGPARARPRCQLAAAPDDGRVGRHRDQRHQGRPAADHVRRRPRPLLAGAGRHLGTRHVDPDVRQRLPGVQDHAP